MVSVEPQGKMVVVRPESERLDSVHGKAFVSQLRPYVDQGAHVLLDFSNVTFINSEALGYITMCLRRLRHRNGSLRVCGLNEGPLSVFRMIRMDQILDGVYDTLEDALAATPS
jgi:anti-anti-sigma factor